MPARGLRSHGVDDSGNVRVTAPCPYLLPNDCPEPQHELLVPAEGYDAWLNGALIQDALPDLSVDDREFLMSGYCPKHMKELFG